LFVLEYGLVSDTWC